ETVDRSKPTRLADVAKDPGKQEDTKIEELPNDQGGVAENPPPVTDEKWEPIPAPLVRRHVITRREGERQWTEVYELPDEDDKDDDTVDTTQRPITAEAPPQVEPQRAPAAGRPGRAKGG